jgi:hypothetical protein
MARVALEHNRFLRWFECHKHVLGDITLEKLEQKIRHQKSWWVENDVCLFSSDYGHVNCESHFEFCIYSKYSKRSYLFDFFPWKRRATLKHVASATFLERELPWLA